MKTQYNPNANPNQGIDWDYFDQLADDLDWEDEGEEMEEDPEFDATLDEWQKKQGQEGYEETYEYEPLFTDWD